MSKKKDKCKKENKQPHKTNNTNVYRIQTAENKRKRKILNKAREENTLAIE